MYWVVKVSPSNSLFFEKLQNGQQYLHHIVLEYLLDYTDTNTKDIRNNSNENVFVKWEILQPCNDTPFWWWILNGCTWPLMLLK